MVVARGELVEIGDGFRIPDAAGGDRRPAARGRHHQPGHPRPTTPTAIGQDTAFVLKVHPSNFVVRGFTSACGVDELAGLGVPVVADIGSGLLAPHPLLPDEPDAATALRAGRRARHGVAATSCSAARRPGWCSARPGRAPRPSARIRRHPLARAMRVDKLTLAALEATAARAPAAGAAGSSTPSPRTCARRAARLAAALADLGAEAARHRGPGGRGRRARTSCCPARRSRCPSTSRPRCGRASPRCSAASSTGAACSTCARSRPRRRHAGRGRAGMHVLATAGHVDHGKSTLVRALTGMEPDR